MAKITLNTITSSFQATSLFNTNFASIATEINDNILYRDGAGANANQMENVLDMNSNDIINVDDLTATTITLNGTPISPTPVTVTALAVTYDNTTSGLTAATVQAALDERVVDFDAHIVDAVDAHDASSISNVASGNLVATEVQAALNELQTELDTTVTGLSGHLADTVDSHDASSISNVASGNLVATEVQAALDELQTELDSTVVNTTTNATGLSDHLADTVDAHDASAISNVAAGNLAATEVQAALNELQTDIDTRLFNDQADTMNGTLTITSTLLDLDNSAAATAAQIKVRNSEGGMTLTTDGGVSQLRTTDSSGGDTQAAVRCVRGGATELYNANVKKFETTSAGTSTTGNTVGTGTATFDGTSVVVGDNTNAAGQGFFAKNSEGGFRILADADALNLQTTNNVFGNAKNAIVASNGAAVDLYYNNVKKFETTSVGATISGDLKCTQSGTPTVVVQDTGAAGTGSVGKFQFLDNASAQQAVVGLNSASDGNLDINANNGQIHLFDNGSLKLNTTSTGAKVTGDLDITAPVFGGIGTNDMVAFGGAHTASASTLFLPISSTTIPVSITVTSTFNVTDLIGTTITGGGTVTPTIGGSVSNKLCIVNVSGLTTTLDKPLLLRQATATSKITVNF